MLAAPQTVEPRAQGDRRGAGGGRAADLRESTLYRSRSEIVNHRAGRLRATPGWSCGSDAIARRRRRLGRPRRRRGSIRLAGQGRASHPRDAPMSQRGSLQGHFGGRVCQGSDDARPEPLIAPQPIALVCPVPLAILLRHLPPRQLRAHHRQDPIEHRAVVVPRSSRRAASAAAGAAGCAPIRHR